MADGRRVHRDRGTLFRPRIVLGDDGNARVDQTRNGHRLAQYGPDLVDEVKTADELSLNMSVDSDRDEDEEYCWIDPNALCPLSALRQLRELRMVYSFCPTFLLRSQPQQSGLLGVPHPAGPKIRGAAILDEANTAAGSCPEGHSSGHEDPDS